MVVRMENKISIKSKILKLLDYFTPFRFFFQVLFFEINSKKRAKKVIRFNGFFLLLHTYIFFGASYNSVVKYPIFVKITSIGVGKDNELIFIIMNLILFFWLFFLYILYWRKQYRRSFYGQKWFSILFWGALTLLMFVGIGFEIITSKKQNEIVDFIPLIIPLVGFILIRYTILLPVLRGIEAINFLEKNNITTA